MLLSTTVLAEKINLGQPAVIDMHPSNYQPLIQTLNSKTQEVNYYRSTNLVIIASKSYRFGNYNCRDTVILEDKKEQGFISCNGGGEWNFYTPK